jgi:hypothetical protein
MQTFSNALLIQQILYPSLVATLPDRRRHRIQPVQTLAQHRATEFLVRQKYEQRGYIFRPHPHQVMSRHRITLAAWRGDEAVATLTLARDSWAGLLADVLYRKELDDLRAQDRVICEVTRLAARSDCSSSSVLADLFESAMEYGKERFGASDAVIEVNPRHARFYQTQYGFRKIGEEMQCPRVNAPAVLMHQEVDVLALER